MATVDRIIDQFPPDQQEQIRVMLADSLKGVIAQVLCKKKEGGRVAALEILLGNAALASLIREGKTFQIPSIMQTSRGMGMVTMNESLLQNVKSGAVDAKEAWMKSVDKNGLVEPVQEQRHPGRLHLTDGSRASSRVSTEKRKGLAGSSPPGLVS